MNAVLHFCSNAVMRAADIFFHPALEANLHSCILVVIIVSHLIVTTNKRHLVKGILQAV